MIVSNRTAFWDGDNFVIVNKNCSKEQAIKLLQILAAADLGETAQAPDSYAEALDESEEKMPVLPNDDVSSSYVVQEMYEEEMKREFRIKGGRYDGLTPAEVIENAEDKSKAFGNLGYLRNKLLGKDDVAATAIGNTMDDYFQQTFGKIKDPYLSVAKLSEQKCDNFLKCYSCILSDEEMVKLLEQSGSLDFDSFMKEASLEQKRSLTAAIIEKHTK
jgi:hypothetical protein